MHRSWLASLFLAVLVSASATGATDVLARFEFDEPHMGTTFRVVLHAPDADTAARASRSAFDRIADLDRRLTDYRDDSELMRACREAVRHPVPVSPDVFRVLSIAQQLARRTEGAFDVTAGALTRLWRHARRQGTLPDAAEIDAARAATGYQLMRLGADDQALWLEREGVRIDVGGIAKGYAADRALEVLRSAGLTRAMVVAGGEMALGDPPPGACGWRVAIAPLEPTIEPGSLEVANAGVSTSGDAEQWMEVDGVRYSHILDPRTGRPLTRRLAVTVVAPDATTSDMLATAVAVVGDREGPRLADEYGAAALMTVETEGGVPREFRSARWTAQGPAVGSARGAGACNGSSSPK